MSRKDARTTSPNRSIWLDLPEDIFRQHLVNLEERTNAVPIAPQALVGREWLPISPYASENSRTLPLEIEQQVADDFACLAAVEEGAQSVAAVCIEEHMMPPRLTLRFAALDISLNDSVKAALQEVSNILAEATSDSKAVSDSVDVLFHQVSQLHFRRLLARLRSTKWEKPKYLSKSHKKPLWQDFANLVHRAQFAYTKKEKASRQLVEKLLNELASVYEGFEGVVFASDDELHSLMDLVQASFTLCSTEAIKDYIHRLETSTSSIPTPQVASAIKCLRQIQKIAAYRRICISLVKNARVYPHLFQGGLKMAYLTPYKSVPTSIGYEEWATSCHVHAEVQLAVYYDLRSPDQESFLRPRCIGISKWLCYLCYQFLRAHRQFFPSRTHGRLYDQWTVPDPAEFDEGLRLRYRRILTTMDEEIVSQTDREPELRRIEPMTSNEIHNI